ncbi:MAG: hypothetical protein LQ339_007355 [Xanthoria mediterranea]|nr:MAG: hypothetical protein LQ339_007355 [Xanthoria mediterranea]
MQALDQTLSMTATDFYGNQLEEIYNYDGCTYPDPSAFGLQFDNTVDTMHDPSTGGMWQTMDNDQSCIDPVLLAMSDPSLGSMDDPSAGGMWQPMDNDQSSIDPSLLAMSDPSLDIASYAFTDNDVTFPSESLDYFDRNLDAPFSPEIPNISTAEFKLPELASAKYYLSQEANNLKRRKPIKPVLMGPRPRKVNQPPIDAAGCWCSLCIGPIPKVNAFDLEILDSSESAQKAARKQNAKRHRDAKKVASGSLKRKARELTPELPSTLDRVFDDFDDDESQGESDGEGSDDGEYRPATKVVKTAVGKRRKVTRQEAKGKGKKMPKGLEIHMNGW